MPIRILDRVFTDFRSRDLAYLRGNAGDYMEKFQYDVEIDFSSNITVSNPMTKAGNQLTLATGSWSDYGFLPGQTLAFIGFTGGGIKTGVVDYIDGAIMYMLSGSYASIPDGTYTKGVVRLIQLPQTVDVYFNLIDENAAPNELSMIDGEAQRFRADNVDTMLAAVGNTMPMNRIGKASGGSNMSLTLERLPDASGLFRFRVYSPFRIWLVNLDSAYTSTNSPKPYFKIVAFPDNTAYKSAITTDDTDFGDCGLVGESHNGGQPQFSVEYVNWTDASANALDVFDFNQDNFFEIKINALGTSFSAGHLFNFFMFTDPKDEANYKNLLPAHENNIMMVSSETPIPMASPTNIGGYANGDGAKISVKSLNIVNHTTHVIITGEIEPNQEFKDAMEARQSKDRIYKVWVRCEDPALSYELSDAMNVEVEEAISIKVPQPLGAYPDLNYFDIEDHNSVVLTGAPIKEDDLLAIARFTLPKYHEPSEWLQAGVRIVARNNVTGEQFTLEETNFWFGSVPNIADGTRPFNFTTPTGFKLPPASDKLNTTLRRYPALDDPTNFGLEFKFGFLVRWEYWLEQLNASDDFFGNKTKDWREYDIVTDWDVLAQLVIQSDEGNYVDDKNFFANIRNYNDWSHTSAITFERLDTTPINNPIEGEICKVIATHTLTADTWNGNEWGQITVEQFENAPRWLMSSILNHGSETDNPLQVLTGETKVKLTISGGATIVTLECLFDASKYPGVSQVSFTSEIDGDTTTSGHESNRIKVTVPISPKPVAFEEEDRGFEQCCEPFTMLADDTDATSWKNDVTSAWGKGDTVTFILKDENGTVTTYTPLTVAFPNSPGAFYTTIQWRDVVTTDGYGCYTIEVESTFAGLTDTIFWGKYDVQPYLLSDGYRMSEGQVRLLSMFNDNNQEVGIDFTGAFVMDTIRFKGKFWNWKTNMETDNIRYTDNTLVKVKREDVFDYEMHIDPSYQQVVDKMLFHLRHENSCWLSDYNRDNHKYYLDLAVIVKEGFEPTSFPGDRRVKGFAVLQDKVAILKSNFHNNGEEVQYLSPPVFQPLVIDAGSGNGNVLKSAQVTSYRTGDDGDLEAGRAVNFFTLAENNPFGNTNRFTDELGTTAYANNIIIDWTTDDGVYVLGYYKGAITPNVTWNTAIDTPLTTVVAGFTPWRCANIKEIQNMQQWSAGASAVQNYFPFNISTNLWTSNRYPGSTAFALLINPAGFIQNVGPSGSAAGYLMTRYFTRAELGL